MYRVQIAELLEVNSREVLPLLKAQEKVDLYYPIISKMGKLSPEEVLKVSSKVEEFLKEGISLKEILEKKYQEVQKVLPTIAPKVKDLLLTNVTDVDGMKDNLQDITQTVKDNTKQDKAEYTYTRKNTSPSELTNLAKTLVNMALEQYKKVVDTISDKSQRISLFLGLVEDEVVKILDEVEPLLRPALNDRVKDAARTITYGPIFTSSKKALNDPLLEDFSGKMEEAEIKEIPGKKKFMVTSPEDEACATK